MNVENGEWEFIAKFAPRSCIFFTLVSNSLALSQLPLEFQIGMSSQGSLCSVKSSGTHLISDLLAY
jgi:hypothetical protein